MEHRPGVRLGEALAEEHVEEDLGMTARHVGVAFALGRLVAEVSPAIDHLLGRAAADAELQATARDQVGRAGILYHVERVLVAHVDHGRAEFDTFRAGAHRGEQRERRRELAREMMDADIGAVGAEFLGGDGQVNRLEQRVGGGAGARLRGGRPVAEREEADFLHRRCLEVDAAADLRATRRECHSRGIDRLCARRWRTPVDAM